MVVDADLSPFLRLKKNIEIPRGVSLLLFLYEILPEEIFWNFSCEHGKYDLLVKILH